MRLIDADALKKTVDNRKPRTNADRIRAMTDEELANWLAMGTVTGACINLGIAPAKCVGFCTECIEEWLKQPAKG